MIVPSMTLEEIRKEIEKDIPILARKMNYVTDELEKKLSKAEKKKGFERFYDYCSKYKNNWMYWVGIKDNKTEMIPVLIYHNGKGHAVITVSPQTRLIYHMPHFFERYNKRCRLGLSNYIDIIRAYILENNTYEFRKIEMIEPGIYKIFCVIKSGIILGMLNNNIKLIKANTFIPNSMLNKNQSEFQFLIANELEKYKHNSGILNEEKEVSL